jgi:hypothetical protein
VTVFTTTSKSQSANTNAAFLPPRSSETGRIPSAPAFMVAVPVAGLAGDGDSVDVGVTDQEGAGRVGAEPCTTSQTNSPGSGTSLPPVVDDRSVGWGGAAFGECDVARRPMGLRHLANHHADVRLESAMLSHTASVTAVINAPTGGRPSARVISTMGITRRRRRESRTTSGGPGDNRWTNRHG